MALLDLLYHSAAYKKIKGRVIQLRTVCYG